MLILIAALSAVLLQVAIESNTFAQIRQQACHVQKDLSIGRDLFACTPQTVMHLRLAHGACEATLMAIARDGMVIALL